MVQHKKCLGPSRPQPFTQMFDQYAVINMKDRKDILDLSIT